MTLTLAKIESTLQQGNATDAQFLLQEWKNTQPETAESLYLQAVTALMLQQYSAAENFLIKALAKKPQQTNYFDTLGKIYAQQEKWQDAAAAFAQAIDNSKTANAEYFSSHATCLHFLEKHDSALAQITTALQLEPNNTQIKSIANLIILKITAAEISGPILEEFCQKYSYPEFFYQLFKHYFQAKRFADCLKLCARGIELFPEDHMLWQALCESAHCYGDIEQSYRITDTYLDKFKSDAMNLRLALLAPHIYYSNEEIFSVRAQLENNLAQLFNANLYLENPEELSLIPFHHAYQGLNDREFMQNFSRLLRQICPALNFTAENCKNKTKRHPKKQIKLGILSRFFNAGVISQCYGTTIMELKKRHPEINLTIFVLGTREDEVTKQLYKHCDAHINLPDSTAHAREIIANQQCDILLYLDLGMDPISYYLAHSRLAPVQCTIGGHPLTSGIDTVDYYISSSLIEAEDAQDHYSEKLILLDVMPGTGPQASYCEKLPSKSELGLPTQGNLYLCPVSPHKIHPDFYAVIATLLQEDSSAQIILHDSQQQTCWRAELENILQSYLGEEIARIHFLPWQEKSAFTATLQHADAVLDPWHFSMGSTMFLVLSLDIPLITFVAPLMRGRGAYARFKSMNIMDTVAHTPEEYISLALKVAQDKDFRNSVSKKIADKKQILFSTAEAADALAVWFKSILEKNPEEKYAASTKNTADISVPTSTANQYSSKQAEEITNRAKDFFSRSNYAQAQQELKPLLQDNIIHAEAWHLEGLCQLANEQPEAAEKAVLIAIAQAKNIAGYHNSLATILRQQNRFDEAINHHLLAEKNSPNEQIRQSFIYQTLSTLEKAQQFSALKAHCEAALKQTPDDEKIQTAHAIALNNLGQKKKLLLS